MAAPAAAPQAIRRRRGRTTERTAPQKDDTATCTAPPTARARGPGSVGTPTMVAALLAAASGSSPRATAIAVDGTPLNTAATTTGRTNDRARSATSIGSS